MSNFIHEANDLVGEKVRVITVHGTFTGKLVDVNSDSIIMHVNISGRIRRILIRLALIIALFRFLGTVGRGYEPSKSKVYSPHDSLADYLIDDD
ncbi:DUF2642 domain-containing protein [Siminovitchia acidinfaciens]|uniref:DUF2642 domain-containing protein n=1 Tax=Siminovitchia acidinfaciens TaxID=2321395 RepID=UPI0019D0D552|nr:DUF2642 domain-containing protein [Siminovitchia acidinfaciens]